MHRHFRKKSIALQFDELEDEVEDDQSDDDFVSLRPRSAGGTMTRLSRVNTTGPAAPRRLFPH